MGSLELGFTPVNYYPLQITQPFNEIMVEGARRRARWLAKFALILLLFPASALAAIFDFSPLSGTVTGYYATGSVRLMSGQNATNIPSGVTQDISIDNGVVGWSSGSTVYSYVFDLSKGRWIGLSASQGPTADLSSSDGVVAWSTSGGVFFRVYDAASGTWVGGSGQGPIAESKLLNADGVVTWSRGNTVAFVVFDPTRNGWQNGSASTGNSVYDLRTADGIVAWSANSVANPQVYRIEYQVYDPRLRRWVSGAVSNGSFTTDLSIQNSVVSWTSGTSTSFVRGYNPNSGAWSNAPTPLAYFAVSTNSGNAPFYVTFVDMSIGGTSWEWSFGIGLGSSNRRSPTYYYDTYGRFEVGLNVNGSVTNRIIVTDTIAPVGTNRINNGASFTTNAAVTLSLSAADNSRVVASMRFSNDSTTWSDWEAFVATKSWMLSTNSGLKAVAAQFRDNAGNVSINASASILLDGTPPPTVSAVNANVDESSRTLMVRVTLSRPYSQPVSVLFATSNGTATASTDYTPTNGLLNFPGSVTNASLAITILPDRLVELNETVFIVFSNPTNVIAGLPGVITIYDDDPATVSFTSTNFNIIEGSGEAHIGVQLSAASGLPVSLRYTATNGIATPNIDFTPVEGLLFFPPGETNQTFSISITNDSVDEFTESIALNLSDSTNAFIGFPSESTLVILDDDNPMVSFTSAKFSISETTSLVKASVRLSKPFASMVSVDYAVGGGSATPGEDYLNAVSGVTFLFQPGQTNKEISVTILNDSKPEYAETIHLALSDFFNVSPGQVIEADIVINDDDGPPLLVAPLVTNDEQFQVSFQGKVGQRFFVEASSNLYDWFHLATLTNVIGVSSYTDPKPTNRIGRFYRAYVLP